MSPDCIRCDGLENTNTNWGFTAFLWTVISSLQEKEINITKGCQLTTSVCLFQDVMVTPSLWWWQYFRLPLLRNTPSKQHVLPVMALRSPRKRPAYRDRFHDLPPRTVLFCFSKQLLPWDGWASSLPTAPPSTNNQWSSIHSFHPTKLLNGY